MVAYLDEVGIPSVSINSPSGEGGGEDDLYAMKMEAEKKFPLILLQAKAGGLVRRNSQNTFWKFPLILLQAKAGGVCLGWLHGGKNLMVSINSPSGEGGGGKKIQLSPQPKIVSINSPSGEGGG
mgnify:CR=1 FL=1